MQYGKFLTTIWTQETTNKKPLFAASGAHWDYVGDIGLESWAKLVPKYGTCSGCNQSLINLVGMVDAKLKPLVFSYDKQASKIFNNGYTV